MPELCMNDEVHYTNIQNWLNFEPYFLCYLSPPQWVSAALSGWDESLGLICFLVGEWVAPLPACFLHVAVDY